MWVRVPPGVSWDSATAEAECLMRIIPICSSCYRGEEWDCEHPLLIELTPGEYTVNIEITDERRLLPAAEPYKSRLLTENNSGSR